MVWTSTAKVEEGKLILAEAVPLPDGAEVHVRIEVLAEAGSNVSPDANRGEADQDFAAFFGMWANRDDMKDSAAWVQRERETWPQRLTQQD